MSNITNSLDTGLACFRLAAHKSA